MLSAVEILVLYYSDGLNMKKGLQQNFWRDQYAISPTKIIKELRLKGYLLISEDLEKILITYSGKELQDAAVRYGIAKSGTKANVSKRIVTEVSKEIILKDFPTQIYELTELGKSTLSENEFVIYVHKNSNYGSINLYDAERVQRENPEFNAVQVISCLYDKAVKKAIREKNYNSATFEDLSHGNFLSREGMNEYALKYILRAIYVRMSGIDRVVYSDRLGFSSYLDTSNFVDFARVDSYMLNDLKKIIMAMSFIPEDTVAYFEKKVIEVTNLPVQILTDEEMKLVLLLELTENYEEVEAFYIGIATRKPIIGGNQNTNKQKKKLTNQEQKYDKPIKKNFLQRLLGR